MSFCDFKVINTSEDKNNSIELIRKWTQRDPNNTSWDHSYGAFNQINNNNKTPTFVSVMITDDNPEKCSQGNVTSSSTQTEEFVTLPVNCSIVDMSLSFSKEFNIINDSASDDREKRLGKRLRRESMQDNGELRPWKKTKGTESCTSSNSDLTEDENKLSIGASLSPSLLSSSSETSFKSINSNSSFKVRKRRMKSDSNLFREALQRSRKSTTLKNNNLEIGTPGGLYY